VQLTQDTVVGNFKVLGKIGAGAMGEVFLAADQTLGRRVALKILSETHRDNPELRARFTREARAVAAISHPNVVQVFATGEWDARPYMVMELLTGVDLAQLLRRDGPLGSARAAAITRDTAQGLAAAARAGLMHRDVKPSNIMILEGGTVKVTDFGLAKPMNPADDPGLTALGVVVGTPDYIAPEQARGDAIDQRVDIYALGCTLFFLLTGRPPYRKSVEDDEKYLKVVARHLRDPVPDPRRDRADVDDELAELQMRMMAKSPDDRPSYDGVIAALGRIEARLGGATGSGAGGTPAGTATRPMSSGGAGAQGGARPARSAGAVAVPDAGPSAQDGDSAVLAALAAAGVRRSRLLMVVTALSVGVFLTGLGLLLFGPIPERALAPPPPPPDAGPPPAVADAGILVDTSRPPPLGMLLVPGAGARAAFWVDRAPISNKSYAEFFPKHRYAKKDAERPVVGVSFEYAQAYARFRGKRLVRVDEFDAAAEVASFVPAGMKLFEWVDDDGATGPSRTARGVSGRRVKKKASGDGTVTFRLAKDP
jgi:serine/threonine-protein kinase